jgi:hypothetical protein
MLLYEPLYYGLISWCRKKIRRVLFCFSAAFYLGLISGFVNAKAMRMKIVSDGYSKTERCNGIQSQFFTKTAYTTCFRFKTHTPASTVYLYNSIFLSEVFKLQINTRGILAGWNLNFSEVWLKDTPKKWGKILVLYCTTEATKCERPERMKHMKSLFPTAWWWW